MTESKEDLNAAAMEAEEESPIKDLAGKKGSKKASAPAAKSRSSTASPGKKGAKKKKVKDDKDEIEWTIPEGKGGKPMNIFMPDRAVMQRLVMRASNLKDSEEPVCEEVRPWMRI